MNGRYLLDTNTISYATSGRSISALRKITAQPIGSVLISCISYAEIWYGLRRKAGATKLEGATDALFAEAEILPWTRSTADVYASLRAEMQQRGKSLAPLDFLIAAHALEAGATLVTSDRAFHHVPGLAIEDWAAE
jgi:tRNA(fMet)-specific endonuclease VapC